jgi:hypothetical protein
MIRVERGRHENYSLPGCYRARTDGYGHWEAMGVLMQWERAEMLVSNESSLTALGITGSVGGRMDCRIGL